MLAALVLSVFATVSSSTSVAASVVDFAVEPGNELPRGAFFGAKVGAVPDDVRDRFKLEAGNGALIEQVIPNSTPK